MKIKGAFPVRWAAQDGKNGNDGVDGKNAYIPSIYVEGAAGYVHAWPFVKVKDAEGKTTRMDQTSTGIGVFSINPSTLEISQVASYSAYATSELSDAINGISDDMFVAIVSYGSSKLDATFSQAIKSLGAPDIVQEKESGGFYPFAMIGKKGMKPGTAAVSYIDIITDDDQRRATAMAYIVGDQLVCASTVTNDMVLNLDNDNDTMLYDGAGNVVGSKPKCTCSVSMMGTDVTSRLSRTATDGDYISISPTGCTVSAIASDYSFEVTGMSADNAKVEVTAVYHGVTRTAMMNITRLVGIDKYEMVCTPGSITYNTSTQVSSGRDVKIQVYRTSQNGARELLLSLPTGYSIKFVRSGQDTENDPLTKYEYGSITITNLVVDHDYYTFLLKDANGKTLDSETIPILKAKNGDAAIRLDLDNEYDSILYSSRGDKMSADVVTNVHVYEGDKEITGSVTSEISVQVLGGSCIESTIKDDAGNKIGKKVTVDSISSDSEQCLVTVTLTHAGTVYTAVFTVKKLVGTDKYDLSVTPTAISYNSTTKVASSSSINILVYRTDANGVRTELESLSNDGLTLEVIKVVSVESSTVHVPYETGGAVVSSLDMTASQYTVTLKKGTSVMDTETVPINKSADGAKGEAGANAIRLDLDNENDTMLYDDLGNLVSGNVTSHATLYNGATNVTSGVTLWTVANTGCEASVSKDGLVTVTAMSASTGKCTVTAKYNNVDYTSVLSLKKVVNGARYEIQLSADSVSVNTSTGAVSVYDDSITANFYRTGTDGVRHLLDIEQSDYVIKAYDVDDDTYLGVTKNVTDAIINIASVISLRDTLVRVSILYNGDILDYADIPILYVSNGADGNGIASHTISFAITTKPVAPDASSSEWVLSTSSNCPKEGTKYKPYLWQLEVITYNNDTSLNKTIIRLVSVYNLDPRPQLLRQTAFDNEDVMDMWYIKRVNVVADTASSNAVAHMASATEDATTLLAQNIFTVGGKSIINAGRYYTFSFYTRTRIPINNTLYGRNLGRIKVWLTKGCTYMMEASFRINQIASGNGKTGFVKFRAASEYSNNDKSIYNSSSYDKRVSLSSSDYFSVSTDGEYTIEFGLYKKGATYHTTESITVNWIRVVPTQTDYNHSVVAYFGEQGCVDNNSDAFKDGVLLTSGGNEFGSMLFYPILDTEENEDDNGWTRHWFAYRTKDSKDNWYLSTSESITSQNVSIRVNRMPYLEIKQPKLEDGIMPTTWCEHKDDDTMYCSHNPCGTWSGLNTYYYCRGQRDVVKYYTDSNKTDMTWWRMRQRTSKAGYNSPTPPYSDPSHWETSNRLKFTIVDSMFAEEIFTDKLTVGRLNTYNNNGSISIEGGLIKVFGNSNAIPQIVMGADENGNAVLSIYDKTGGKVWDLSVNGLKGIDIIEMKMTEVKYYNVSTHVQGATLSNDNLKEIVNAITSGESLTSYYQFSCKKQMNNGVVMLYYYGTNATEGTNTPPPNEGKYYASSSTNATTLLPTGARMPTGLYTHKTKNHYSTMPDEGTGVAVYRCALSRVNNGVFAAGNRYIEWKIDKTYIHLVDGANEYTFGSLQ